LNLLYSVSKAFLYLFFKIFYRLEVIGIENVPDEGGVIIAANHMSYLDPPLIGAALKRRATYMAKEGLFNIPLIGSFIRAYSLPVKRGRPQPSIIKDIVKRLKNGELIVIFPEGSRSMDGSITDAKRGIGVISAMSKATVVPTLLMGTEKALPVGAKFLKPSKIRVIFGTPVKVDRESSSRQFQEHISSEITEALKTLRKKFNDKKK